MLFVIFYGIIIHKPSHFQVKNDLNYLKKCHFSPKKWHFSLEKWLLLCKKSLLIFKRSLSISR